MCIAMCTQQEKKTSLHALLMMLSLAKACDHWLKPVITFHCATKTCLKSPCRPSINVAGHETSSTQGNHNYECDYVYTLA